MSDATNDVMNDATNDAAHFSIPRIRTRRLLLRELRRSDFDAFAEHMADPIATEHLGGGVDRRAAWRMLGAGLGFWALDGAGWWGIELVSSGEIVGTVGAFFRERHADLELGWFVYRPFWRQGIATEAAVAARDFGFERHAAKRVIAHVDHANVASIRVTAHLGMHYEAEVELYGETTGRYAIER